MNGCCAVCAQAVPAGRLMCPGHWRQLPLAMQRDVWRSWKEFQNRRNAVHGLRLLAQYRQASDAAIGYVRSINNPKEKTT